jgi:predicted membrane channel-forming protein YqfA (hemolysin III family)
MSYRARRRWSLAILLIGLPLFIVAAVTAMNWLDARFGRQPIWIEVLVYVALGVVWALPFRAVFRGIGQADPDDTPPR